MPHIELTETARGRIAHFMLSAVNCVGFCVSCGRERRAKKAKGQSEHVVELDPVVPPPPYTEATS